jgi:hypothetical protein
MAKAKKGLATRKGAVSPTGAAPPRGAASTRGDAKGKAARKAPLAEDLDALRKPVEEAKAALEATEAEAKEAARNSDALVIRARETLLRALTPYRLACRKADRPCEFEGARGANVSERVSFLVERVDQGVRVAVEGKPDTEEVIPMAALKKSVNREAYRYVGAHIGPREKVGNKGGSLSNRLRAVLR